MEEEEEMMKIKNFIFFRLKIKEGFKRIRKCTSFRVSELRTVIQILTLSCCTIALIYSFIYSTKPMFSIIHSWIHSSSSFPLPSIIRTELRGCILRLCHYFVEHNQGHKCTLAGNCIAHNGTPDLKDPRGAGGDLGNGRGSPIPCNSLGKSSGWPSHFGHIWKQNTLWTKEQIEEGGGKLWKCRWEWGIAFCQIP